LVFFFDLLFFEFVLEFIEFGFCFSIGFVANFFCWIFLDFWEFGLDDGDRKIEFDLMNWDCSV
jgi:hypothetical protein